MKALTGEERRKYLRDCMEARRNIVTRAVSFEEKLQLSKEQNTREAEDAVDRALEALGAATRKYLRIAKRRR